jgi:hypothetical protein
MERSGAAIVSKATPCSQHRFLTGPGKPGNVGKLPQKCSKALLDHCHSGLLQHDLRNQDAVRIALAAPWKIAFFAVKPAQKMSAEASTRGRVIERSRHLGRIVAQLDAGAAEKRTLREKKSDRFAEGLKPQWLPSVCLLTGSPLLFRSPGKISSGCGLQQPREGRLGPEQIPRPYPCAEANARGHNGHFGMTPWKFTILWQLDRRTTALCTFPSSVDPAIEMGLGIPIPFHSALLQAQLLRRGHST